MIIMVFKILWTCAFHRPDQQFVNELYTHQQAKHYQRHYGIKSNIPDGKYLKQGTVITWK